MYFIVVLFITFLSITIVIALAKYIDLRNYRKKFDLIEKQKNNYENIIEKANDAMLVIDIVDGRIHQCNPSASELLGYTKAELERKTLFDLHPKSLLEKSSKIVADVWEKGGLIYKDIPFITSSGEELPVECSAKVAPFAGRPAIVIYARDIRERLRLEREVLHQKEIIEEKNKDITDSITYAKRIQEAMMPSYKEISETLSDFFILYKPKDIVSGDFYWHTKMEQLVIIAAADCTGHGVPGAFMSMIGNSFLDQIVKQREVLDPSEILGMLRLSIIGSLKQTGAEGEQKDGMDIALCVYNPKTKKLKYAGAHNPLYIIRDAQLTEIKADKVPIGVHIGKELKPFTTHEVQLHEGDSFYIFTDGYADQFGGPQGKKFKYKQMQELLKRNSHRTMNEIRMVLDEANESWMSYQATGSVYGQIDDILVIGVRA